jgi:hypothetical protein
MFVIPIFSPPSLPLSNEVVKSVYFVVKTLTPLTTLPSIKLTLTVLEL